MIPFVIRLISFSFVLFVLVGGVLGFGAQAQAADYYISPTTTSTNWIVAQNINTPCTPVTAMTNAQAGDTVYFRAGTYTISGESFSPVASGTSYAQIVFSAYPGEVVTLAGDSSRNVIMEAYHDNYITFDGFRLTTQMDIAGPQAVMVGTGNVIKNCEFIGKSWGGLSNSPAIYLPSTNVNCLIQNNLIYGYVSTASTDNTCAIMIYASNNLTIEKNTIRNCSGGIYVKQNNNGVTIRKNLITEIVTQPAVVIQSSGGDDHYERNIDIYQNIIVNNKYFAGLIINGGVGNLPTKNIKIYNNIFYNNAYGFSWPDVNINDLQEWNNIWSDISGSVTKAIGLTYCDYNTFVNTPQLCP